MNDGIITGNEMTKLALDEFAKWLEKYKEDNPDDDRSMHKLVETYVKYKETT